MSNYKNLCPFSFPNDLLLHTLLKLDMVGIFLQAFDIDIPYISALYLSRLNQPVPMDPSGDSTKLHCFVYIFCSSHTFHNHIHCFVANETIHSTYSKTGEFIDSNAFFSYAFTKLKRSGNRFL